MSHRATRRHSSAVHSPATRHLLSGLAKDVIEAVLEAELADHLGGQFGGAGQGPRTFANSRNGTRRKTVRTALGPIAIDAPRDRWGTFAPLTVGKWQREVVGIDHVLVPLAARDAPSEETVDLLSLALPEAPRHLLRRIAAHVRTRLAPWHHGRLDATYPALQVHLSAARDVRGRAAGFPVASVVGVLGGLDADGLPRRELVGLYAVPAVGNPWDRVLTDVHERGVRGVVQVVGEQADSLRDPVARLWPGAEITERHTPTPRIGTRVTPLRARSA